MSKALPNAKLSRLTGRTCGAWLGLLALFFLQAPIVGAALMAATGLCCTADYCPIDAHHHSSPVVPGFSPTSEKSEEAPMDCGHGMKQNAGKMHSCSMSCCHTTEQFAVHAQVFVPSPLVTIADRAPLAEVISAVHFAENAGFNFPLSPPPKSLQSNS